MRDPRRSIVLSTLARALPLIIGVTVIFGAAGILLSRFQQVTYTAETQVALSQTSPFDPLGNDSNAQAARHLANQEEFIDSRPVLELAVAKLANPASAPFPAGTAAETVEVGALDQAVEVAASESADVLTITTTGPTGPQAAARGVAVAYAYSDAVRALVAADAQAATVAATAAAEEAAAAAALADPQAVPDRTLPREIALRATTYDDGVRSVESPDVPEEPTAPNPLRNGFLLGALGLLLTTGLVIARRGQPVADRGALVESAGAPVLGVVPVPLRRLSRRKAPPLPQAREFSMALVALGYAAHDPSGVVMITGITRDSGAPSVALGLAAAAAEQQRRVVVVDADTQGSDLVRHSGQEGPELAVGALADPSTAEHRAVTELVRLRPASGGGSVHLASVAAHMPSRGGPDAVRDGLQRLVDGFDMVVLHAGPVADDPMAFALLREASVVVGVVDETARTADLLALREKLELAGAQCDGLVLTRPVASRRRPAAAPPAATIPEVFGSAPTAPLTASPGATEPTGPTAGPTGPTGPAAGPTAPAGPVAPAAATSAPPVRDGASRPGGGSVVAGSVTTPR
jgi:capsular polysaccharide biosynthesis protein